MCIWICIIYEFSIDPHFIVVSFALVRTSLCALCDVDGSIGTIFCSNISPLSNCYYCSQYGIWFRSAHVCAEWNGFLSLSDSNELISMNLILHPKDMFSRLNCVRSLIFR